MLPAPSHILPVLLLTAHRVSPTESLAALKLANCKLIGNVFALQIAMTTRISRATRRMLAHPHYKLLTISQLLPYNDK